MTQKIILIIGFCFAQIWAFAQVRIDAAFTFQSVSKEYSLYIPSGYNPATANKMMVGFHPFNTSRWDAEAWCDTLTNFAEANQLILVCPDGGPDGRVDDPIDTAFTTVLIDSMVNWYNISQYHIYAMGFSVGGRATYTYSFSHPNRIAGLIPIGAAITGTSQVTPALLQHARCKPVYIVHGANDATNTRFYPIRNALMDSGAVVNSLLMPGVGHTIDFPNRNAILTNAYQWIDSVHTTLPALSLSVPDTICLGDSSMLEITGGEGCNLAIRWEPAIKLGCAGCRRTWAAPTSTTTFHCQVNDSLGNTWLDSVVVVVNQPPPLSVTSTVTICEGDSAMLQVSGGVSYSWNPVSGLSCFTCPNPLVSPLTSTVYMVTAMGPNGCESSATVPVRVIPKPVFSLAGSGDVCLGDSLFTSSPVFPPLGTTFQWTPSQGLSCDTCDGPVIFVSQNISYNILITDGNGCSRLDTFDVSVLQPPVYTITADTSICKNACIDLQIGGGHKVQWEPNLILNDPNSAYQTICPTQTEVFYVMVTDSFSCSAWDSVKVEVSQNPTAAFTEKIDGLEVTFTESSLDATTWYWDFGDGTSDTLRYPVHVYPFSGTYEVCLVVENTTHCQDTFCSIFTLVNTVGLEQVSAESFQIFPNPVESALTLRMENNWQPGSLIEVLDLTGRVFMQKKVSGPNFSVDMDQLASGMYWIRLSNPEGQAVKKVLKL